MKFCSPLLRIVLFLLTASLCFVAAVQAQTAGKPLTAPHTMAMLKKARPQERAKFQTDMLNTCAPLSSSQYQKVYAITTKYALKVEPIMKSDDSQFSKYRQVKSLMSDRDGELKPVLNAEQWKKYEALKDELMARAKEYKESH